MVCNNFRDRFRHSMTTTFNDYQPGARQIGLKEAAHCYRRNRVRITEEQQGRNLDAW